MLRVPMNPILSDKTVREIAAQIPDFLENVASLCPDLVPGADQPLTDANIAEMFAQVVTRSGFFDLDAEVTDNSEIAWSLQRLLEDGADKVSTAEVLEWLADAEIYYGSPLDGIFLYSFKWPVDDMDWVIETAAHDGLLAYCLFNGLPFEEGYRAAEGPLPVHVLAVALCQSPIDFSVDEPYSPALIEKDGFLAWLATFYDLPGMPPSPFLAVFEYYDDYSIYVRWDDLVWVQEAYSLYLSVCEKVPKDVVEMGPAWLVGNVARYFKIKEAWDDE